MASIQITHVSDAGVRTRHIQIGPLSMKEAIARKGIDEVKARRNMNARLHYRVFGTPISRSFPSGHVKVADYVRLFCALNHLKEC